MKFFFSFLLLTSLVSCSKDYQFKKNEYYISKTINEIKIADQAVRNYKKAVNFKYGIRTANTVWDSLQRKEAKMNAVNVNALPHPSQQLERLSLNDQKAYKKEIEGGEFLMLYVDSISLEQIYKITKKYGYPSYDARPWSNDSLRTGCGFVLTHFDYNKERSKELLKLLIKENKRKRFTDEEMRYLIWHVNGRLNLKDMDSVDIEKWTKNYLMK